MPKPDSWLIDEWNLFQLARWLGVPPWEMMQQDDFWRKRALFFMDTEAGVVKARMDRKERK